MKIILMLLYLVIINSSCGKDSGDKQMISGTSEKSENETAVSTENKVNSDSTDAAKGTEIKLSGIKYGKEQVPASLIDENEIIEAVSWNDKLGKNLLVITLTEERTVYEDNRIKEFFVHHYVMKNGKYEVLWKTYDFVKDCPFDITLEFIDSSLTVTDLDENDLAETSFIYKLSCRSDVSPDDMKLIMHEGHDKFAIRGEMILKINDEEPTSGSMDADVSFKKVPAAFKDYAVKQWNKFNKVFIGEKYEK